MVTRFENDYGDIIESEDGPFVLYEDYKTLEALMQITDVAMPPRVEHIDNYTPKQVEEMWMHRVRWLCRHLGVKVHG